MQIQFDARQVPPSAPLDPIPAGWYIGVVDESEIVATKDGTGAYLKLGIKIIDGPHAGRKVYDRLNVQNTNPVAAEIAHRRLSSVCHATRMYVIQDTQQLHNIPLKVKVKLKAADGNYEAQNDVSGYADVNDTQHATNAAPAAGPSFAPQPAAPVGYGQPAPAYGAPVGYQQPAAPAPAPAAAWGPPVAAPPTAAPAAPPGYAPQYAPPQAPQAAPPAAPGTAWPPGPPAGGYAPAPAPAAPQAAPAYPPQQGAPAWPPQGAPAPANAPGGPAWVPGAPAAPAAAAAPWAVPPAAR